MEQCLEEQTRYMGEDFGDFLTSVKVLSGESNENIGIALGVTKRAVTGYLTGDFTPSEARQQAVREIFDLNDSEIYLLFPPIVEPLSPEERRAQGQKLGESPAEFLSTMKYLSRSTNDSIATALGVDSRTVGNYLKGRHVPSEEVRQRMREIFGLDNEELASIFGIIEVTPLDPEERRARSEYLGRSLPEFLGAIKYLSGSTNREMGIALGISNETVSDYVNGKKRPSPITQQKIKKIFSLSDDELDAILNASKVTPLDPEERRERNELLGVDIAEFLHTMRFLSGSTAGVMATALGISERTLSGYLGGRHRPSEVIQQRIRETFDLNREEMKSLLIEPSRKSLERRDEKLARQIGNTSWKGLANCRGVNPEIFHALPNKAETLKAKNICEACLVAKECLEFALANEIDVGIWGGVTGPEREQILGERRQAS